MTQSLKSENLLKIMTSYYQFFKKSHLLKRNVIKLVYLWKEKIPKLKIFISSLFHKKKILKFEIKFRYDFLHSFK